MSDDMTAMHHVRCDWPGCRNVSGPDAGKPSYGAALGSLEEGWLHFGLATDYCPDHWHMESGMAKPGPLPDYVQPIV